MNIFNYLSSKVTSDVFSSALLRLHVIYILEFCIRTFPEDYASRTLFKDVLGFNYDFFLAFIRKKYLFSVMMAVNV